jgi:Tol biopolymer transport system component
MALEPGSRMGRYEIVSFLGAGGMGEVYRARDTKLDRDVAIKVLPAEFTEDHERLARFEREARLLAQFQHPNIASVFGLEESNGVRALVMEFVDGEDLGQRLASGPLPLDECLLIARQIAEGLEAAHEKGVVHRDLKPANVKLTRDGVVKILDFGLAKAFAGNDRGGSSAEFVTQSPTLSRHMTEAGMILGTAAYMSPEQARGRPVDKRTDIWSFGVVLWEMLTARRLFEGETVTDVLAAVVKDPVAWDALPAATPASIRELLRRCLDRDPKSRLRDIGEARVLLDRVGNGSREADVAAPPRRRPWRAMLVAAAAAGLVTAGAFRLLAPASRPAALRKLDLVAPDLDLDWNIGPVLSPDGSRVAYSAGNRIWVRDLDQLQARSVAEVSAATPLGWSPDSRALVFSDLKKLWTVPAQGGAPVAISEIPGTGSIIGAAWSPSGRIAVATWRGGMYEVPSRGGAPTLMFEADPKRRVDFHDPSWLPNGDLLYVIHWKDSAANGRKPTLAVWDGTKEIPLAIDVGDGDPSPKFAPQGFLLYVREGENAGIWGVPYDVRGRRAAGEAFRVTPAGLSPSAAADGSLLFVEQASADAVNEMAWLDRSGRTVGVVEPARVGLSQPMLSPDGRRVVFAAGPPNEGDIWVQDLERSTATRLTFGREDEWGPAWLSSLEVAYVQLTKSIRGRILSVKADGSGQPRVVVPDAPLGNTDDPALVVVPGGRSVLQIVDERGHGRLRVGDLQADGRVGPLRPVLKIEPEPDVSEARVSPDGRLLAYVADNDGKPELFLTRFPSGVGRWQVTTEAARHPRWARRTGELFFLTGQANDTTVAARVDPGLDPPVGAPMILFKDDKRDRPGASAGRGSGWDVAADGQRLLVVRRGAGATARRMVLVQNWASEFKGTRTR